MLLEKVKADNDHIIRLSKMIEDVEAQSAKHRAVGHVGCTRLAVQQLTRGVRRWQS